MNILQRSYLKLADTKKGKRVWIQGLRLEEAGYHIGTCYEVNYDDDNARVTLTITDDGSNKVSRKKIGDNYFPLIDIVNQQLESTFGDIDRVQVVITEGCICIEYHLFDRMKVERERKLEAVLRAGGTLTTASVAHGAGLMDFYLHKGFASEGLRCGQIWAVEPVNDYLQTSLRNNPIWSYESQAIEGRIEDIDSRDLNSPLVLCAGLPCTGASRSGRVKNKLAFAEQHETAGTAFIGWLQLIRQLSPSILVLENVEAYQSTVSMHMIRETLSDWRYTIHETIVGSELGAFEDRKRMCMVAVSSGIDFRFDLKPVRQAERTLGEILDDVPLDSDRWKSVQYLHDKELRDKKAGKGFSMQIVTDKSTKVKTIGAGYAKWRSTEPLIQHPVDKKLKRLLTVREHCRVKGIDEKLVAGLSATKAHQCLGQSVLGPAFQAIGRNIAECLNRQYRKLDAVA